MTPRRVMLLDNSYYPSTPFFVEPLRALEKEGVEFVFVDEKEYVQEPTGIGQKIRSRLSPRIPGLKQLNEAFVSTAIRFRPDVIIVVKGSFLSPDSIDRVRQEVDAILINYATDDPFNQAVSSQNLIESIPLYDFYACTKTAIMEEVRRAGAARVSFVRFGYRPSIHFAEPLDVSSADRFECDISFIGTMDEDRPHYFEALIESHPGIRINLFGGGWDRHKGLKRFWRGHVEARDFRQAIAGSRFCLNLLRKKNRDGHTMRSFEIPACGGLMLAEPTADHRELFDEGTDVVFFSTTDELGDRVGELWDDQEGRARIAETGRRRVEAGAHTYQDRLTELLDAVR